MEEINCGWKNGKADFFHLYGPSLTLSDGWSLFIGRLFSLNERKHLILLSLSRLSALPSMEPFTRPVDLDFYPDYARYIDYPSDLDTVAQRLHNGYYRYDCLSWLALIR